MIFDLNQSRLICTGNWTIDAIPALTEAWQRLDFRHVDTITIDGSLLENIDSAAGLLLTKWLDALKQQQVRVMDFQAPSQIKNMLGLVSKTMHHQQVSSAEHDSNGALYFVGKETIKKKKQVDGFFALLGELFVRFYRALFNWRQFHFKSMIRIMELTGIQALPILALLSFLIGIVLTYQMGLQLKTYGANIYIVYITGMALQREFAPLITAIIVAGRTSSAFTAQLGSMKVNEEIDALQVMGLAPTELLVLPKILGMLVVFPILIFWSVVFGTAGAMFMSKWMLDINFYEFIDRLRESLGVRQYLLGLVKAPVFALLIALVGCFQGFQVKGSANSVGLFTTKAVVQAIFLIIVADALFSIIFTWLDL